MRKPIIVIAIMIQTMQVMAQLQVNPQAGINTISFSNPPEGFDYSKNVGLMLGCDVRFGDRVQFQPGLYYMTTQTTIRPEIANYVIPDQSQDWIRTKAFGAIQLLEMGNFKLRVNGGISYDFLISSDAKNEHGTDISDDLNSGSLDLNLGIGADFLILTADLGYNLGMTDVYKSDSIAPDSRYEGIYFTLGLIFGKKETEYTN